MARALADIFKELGASYDPQRNLYNQHLTQLDPQQEAEIKGLEYQKEDVFQGITNQANRRGLFYSGLPIQEQQKYTGSQFLPAVANLKGKYATQKFGIQDALAQLFQKQNTEATGIHKWELEQDENKRRWEAEQAARREAEAASARAAAAGSGGGGGAPVYEYQPTQAAAPQAPQLSLRQRWQQEAKAGDWNAQVALNYAGDDGRYDGPVNSQDEYNRLKSVGIIGNYYVRQGSGGSGSVLRSGGGSKPGLVPAVRNVTGGGPLI